MSNYVEGKIIGCYGLAKSSLAVSVMSSLSHVSFFFIPGKNVPSRRVYMTDDSDI